VTAADGGARRSILGLLLGLAIGAGCRVAAIPVPSQHTLLGALLVVSITVGYLAADRLLPPRPAPPAAAAPAPAADPPPR
jgi:XapX domain-containing protein